MIIRALNHSKLLAFAYLVLVLYLLSGCGESAQEPEETPPRLAGQWLRISVVAGLLRIRRTTN